MGKRVVYSARSVIGPDPILKISELGVPIKIAMNITFPEVVTSHNISYLTKLVNKLEFLFFKFILFTCHLHSIQFYFLLDLF